MTITPPTHQEVERLLYFFHPLTPLESDAFRPRYVRRNWYSPSVEMLHFSIIVRKLIRQNMRKEALFMLNLLEIEDE